MTGGPTDRGTFAPHVPCNCSPHCEVQHGDQAESAEQLEIYRLRAELKRVRDRLAEHSRKWGDVRAQRGRQIADLKEALSAAFKKRDEALVQLDRAHKALARIAEVLRTPQPGIVDVLWAHDGCTLYELAIGPLPADHPEVLLAERGGA